MPPLPVLNLHLQRTNPTLFSKQLVKACHEIGFFLLEHDLPNSICERALSETRLFFQKPLEQKMSIYYGHEPSFRGYMPMGVENTEGKTDGREQIEYAAEYGKWKNSSGRCNHNEEEHFYHRLRVAENPWPDTIQPSLRPAINDYVDGVLKIGDQLRDALCLGMGIDPSHLSDSMFRKTSGDEQEPNFWSMKLVSYPPPVKTTNNSASDTEYGVGAHADSNFLTMILQDAKNSGLQVQTIDGKWIDVPPTPANVLICNIGELAQIFSGGYLMATPHRVLRPQDSRISLPVFYNPKLDHVMESMVNPEELTWNRKGQNQWLRKENALMGSVGENSFKSLARSHAEVFKRHHGDLHILGDGRIQLKKNT
ncbi:iron/ascorbate-dependent oxidoreductase family protein [Skeletonema marinoi]|uniref:Iron/ascorbate-dependent oxidoreductase family protein n=1 Tax=Skeletonema marinoi TaxID=267567 RepID=A0AAD9D498_9STRA|nr:iron/ascorbate-dependent oxidoreductase family protein [Skeletonema marinoi]